MGLESFPTRGLTPIDIRAVRVISTALGWEVEIARSTVMREFGLESLSSTQVSRATRLLDEELAAWRNRPLGEIRYLLLDGKYHNLNPPPCPPHRG